MFEVDIYELFPRLKEILDEVQAVEWTLERIGGLIVSVLGAIGTIFGIVIKWRNSGKNRAKRLEEYLEERERRIYGARSDLREITARPQVQQANDQSRHRIFKHNSLQKMAKKKGWVHIFGAKSQLPPAMDRASDGIRVARRAEATAEHELFLARLTHGATKDSLGDHYGALTCFDSALSLRPDDLQALEFAGVQLTLIGSAASAIEHLDRIVDNSGQFTSAMFEQLCVEGAEVTERDIKYLTRMLAKASERKDNLNIARAHRSISFAFESEALASNSGARKHAKLATSYYPGNAPTLEVGEAWERLGWLTYKFNSSWGGQAQTELRQAKQLYKTLSSRRLRRSRIARVEKLIAEVSGKNKNKLRMGLRSPIFFKRDDKSQDNESNTAPPNNQPDP